jgi:hypothetical protein
LTPRSQCSPDSPITPYPLRCWKVVAAINASGKLFATAYILDQRESIAEFGLRGAPEVPFTPYKTFQTTIAAIEKLSQLRFIGTKGASRMSLSVFDPLTKRKAKQRLGQRPAGELAEQEPAVPLTRHEQIVLNPSTHSRLCESYCLHRRADGHGRAAFV